MFNARTISGVMLCTLGIVLVKLQSFVELRGVVLTLTYCTGIFISFAGLAVFSSGLRKRIIQKVKICPDCFYKNKAEDKTCRKCKKDLS